MDRDLEHLKLLSIFHYVFTLIVLVRENVKRQFDVPAVSGYGKG